MSVLPHFQLRLLALPLLAFAAVWAGGCSHDEYDLVQPGDLARHIGPRTTTVPWAPLEYRFNSVEDHLVVRVFNGADEPIRLLGEESVVVDPKGQSHPLAGRVIAPRSFVKLVLPPLRPVVGPVGPTIGFGFGFGGGYYRRGFRHFGYFYDDPFWYPPAYYGVYDDGGQGSLWSWPEDGAVRLELVYQRSARSAPPPAVAPATGPATGPAALEDVSRPTAGDAAPFIHRFVFRQRKV